MMGHVLQSFVIVPGQQVVVVHPLNDAVSLSAPPALHRLASTIQEDLEYPISTDLFWTDDGRNFERVGIVEKDSTIEVHPPMAFLKAIERFSGTAGAN